MQNTNTVKPEGQLALFEVGGIIDEAIAKVFGPKQIKNGKGVIVGSSVGLRSRRDIASALSLKGKDNKEALDTAILAESDKAFRSVKSTIAGLNGEWTLKRVANRTMGNGERQISVVLREVKRRDQTPDLNQLARALGLSVDEIKDAIAADKERQSVQDVQTVLDTAPAEQPVIEELPTLTPEMAMAAALGNLEVRQPAAA